MLCTRIRLACPVVFILAPIEMEINVDRDPDRFSLALITIPLFRVDDSTLRDASRHGKFPEGVAGHGLPIAAGTLGQNSAR
jgi:hypothetical protein